MKLLILGGTRFLGRGVVEEALARGHELTLFTRGQTNPELFPEAEHLRGDRDGDLGALEGRAFDAVVDPSGYVPRLVRASAELLRASGAGRYVFVSSISVYSSPLTAGFDENAPLATMEQPTEEVTGESYGPLKVACEEVVRDVFPGAHANVRAGLIVGPHDPTGRFTYWLERFERGGEVLAPGDPDRTVQFVNVRDLGAWIVRVCEDGVVGDFNAVGPDPPVTMGELLESCRRVAGSDAGPVWVDESFLVEREVGQWMELPLWLAGPEAAMLQADISCAVAAGLRFRPLDETVRDTLEWVRGGGSAVAGLASGLRIGEAGMRPEREAELLEEWRTRG